MAPHDGVTLKKNRLGQIIRELGARPRHIAVGVIGAKGQVEHNGTKGATVADVASWNHFGTSTIPARPFLTIAFAKHGDRLRAVQARIIKGVIEGKLDLDRGLDLLGLEAAALVKQTIIEHVPPPNKPSTIERKGSSTPLVDKGQLLGAIQHEVRDGR
jgi:hypothetical protein